MITSKAPLLKPLRTSGGTFITFSSAVNDISLMIGDSDVRSIASKFALLKLPEWKNVVDTQHMYEEPANIGLPLVSTPNTVFPKLLQNYVENFIQYSEQERLDNDNDTVAEIGFWKLLKRIGGIEFVEDEIVLRDGLPLQTYKEADENATYEHVIKYIGDVNSLNYVKKYGREYIEVFAHVESNAGYLQKVRFIPVDVVHEHALIPDNGGGFETIGLEDFDNAQNYAIYDTIDKKYDISTDDNLLGIDFVYHSLHPEFKDSGNFDFNAILLYNDTFSKTDATTRRTNLFGLLLLEPFDNSVSPNISTLKKFQADSTQAGNSHVFRFNLNISTQTDQITSDVVINDYSTVSMQMYTDALRRMTESVFYFENIQNIVTDLQQQVVSLQQYVLSLQNVQANLAQIEQNKNDILRLSAGQAKQGDVRISNEDLFLIFDKTIKAVQQNSTNTVNNTIITTHKAMLPTLVDKTQLIVETGSGEQYKWNSVTNEWDLI